MFAHLWMRGAALRRRPSASLLAIAALLGASVLLQACSAAPSAPLAGPDPADPKAPVAPTAYRSAIGTYKSERPVEPRPWREQNEGVTPAPKQ